MMKIFAIFIFVLASAEVLSGEIACGIAYIDDFVEIFEKGKDQRSSLLKFKNRVGKEIFTKTGGEENLSRMDSLIYRLKNQKAIEIEEVDEVVKTDLGDFFGDKTEFNDVFLDAKSLSHHANESLEKLKGFVSKVKKLNPRKGSFEADDFTLEVPVERITNDGYNRTIDLVHGDTKFSFTTFLRKEPSKLSKGFVNREYIAVRVLGLKEPIIISGDGLNNKISSQLFLKVNGAGGPKELVKTKKPFKIEENKQSKVLKEKLISSLKSRVLRALQIQTTNLDNTVTQAKEIQKEVVKLHEYYNINRKELLNSKAIRRDVSEDLASIKEKLMIFFRSAENSD